MNEFYQPFEKNAVVQTALRPGGVESFCDTDGIEDKGNGIEDPARCNGWRDGLVVGGGKSSIGGVPTESVSISSGNVGISAGSVR